LTPKSWLLPVLGGAAVLWLGWRWRHRPTPAARASAALPVDASAHHPDALVAGSWAGLLILRRLVGRRDR
jgi:hypothetical protein